MLHSPELGKWCGPSAISILTGVPYSKVVPLLGPDFKEGLWMEEAILALWGLGYTSHAVKLPRMFMTLRDYLAQRPPSERVEPMLIQVLGHVLTAHGDWLSDNNTKTPVHITNFRSQKRRVVDVYIIRRMTNAVY